MKTATTEFHSETKNYVVVYVMWLCMCLFMCMCKFINGSKSNEWKVHLHIHICEFVVRMRSIPKHYKMWFAWFSQSVPPRFSFKLMFTQLLLLFGIPFNAFYRQFQLRVLLFSNISLYFSSASLFDLIFSQFFYYNKLSTILEYFVWNLYIQIRTGQNCAGDNRDTEQKYISVIQLPTILLNAIVL